VRDVRGVFLAHLAVLVLGIVYVVALGPMGR
jgi:hypothetical protein